MAFKLGSEKRTTVPVFRKNLGKNILGEANMDGSIYIDKSVKPGSALEKQVISHEKDHAMRMASGELSYGDDFVRFRGKTYARKDGKIKYNGKWLPEGDSKFPWEKRAEKAE